MAIHGGGAGVEEAAVLQESGSSGLSPSLLPPPVRAWPGGWPDVTVVVPTRDERENIAALLERLDALHPDLRLAVLFVDDSDDGTPDEVRKVAASCSRPVSVIHRPPEKRDGGLGGAVLAGIRAARSEWICVMDADLQHPPELLAALIEEARRRHSDLVVASRYCRGGDLGDFSVPRAALSRSSGLVARAMFPQRLRTVSDPMSGFFLVRKAALDLTTLRPRGFKILLEIVVRGGPLAISEVPFRFGERWAGESKASLGEGLRYVRRLIELRVGAVGTRDRPAECTSGPSARPDRQWRFRHHEPAVWNRNGTTGGEHGSQRSVLT